MKLFVDRQTAQELAQFVLLAYALKSVYALKEKTINHLVAWKYHGESCALPETNSKCTWKWSEPQKERIVSQPPFTILQGLLLLFLRRMYRYLYMHEIKPHSPNFFAWSSLVMYICLLLGLEQGPSILQSPIGMVCRISPAMDERTCNVLPQQIICRGKSPKHAVDGRNPTPADVREDPLFDPVSS